MYQIQLNAIGYAQISGSAARRWVRFVSPQFLWHFSHFSKYLRFNSASLDIKYSNQNLPFEARHPSARLPIAQIIIHKGDFPPVIGKATRHLTHRTEKWRIKIYLLGALERIVVGFRIHAYCCQYCRSPSQSQPWKRVNGKAHVSYFSCPT